MRNIYDTNDHWYLPFDVITIWLFSPSWLITEFVTRVTRQVALVEHDLFTHPDNLSLPWFLMWFVLLNILFSLFVLFLLAILLHVLRFMASDYPFRIFRLFWIPNEWKKDITTALLFMLELCTCTCREQYIFVELDNVSCTK